MKQEANKYLRGLLTDIKPYILSAEESKKFQRDKVGFIADKLLRKDFRRFATAKTKENLKTKVGKFIEKSEPIHFTVPFGGYKHYWNPSHPEPDWAEVFNFRFFTDYLHPILTTYKPGAVVEYISEDLIIPLMNNYTPESTKQYWDIFTKLMEWYQQFAPKNLTFTGFRICDRYDANAIIKDVEKVVSERIRAFHDLPDDKKTSELHRSVRSVKWNGLENLTNLSDAERKERIIESRVTELAYYETESKPEFLGNYLWDNISLFLSGGKSGDNIFHDLTVKSNYGSVVDFWIGRGLLEYENGIFTPRTVSKNQYAELKLEKIEISPMLISPKNFAFIDVVSS